MEESLIQRLYIQYADDVHKFLTYFTRNRDVEDLLQETFIKAMKGLRNFRGENEKSWLFAIARNVAIDHARETKRKVTVEQDAISNLRSLETSPEDWVQLKDEEQRILSILHGMKDVYRDVVICRAFMDMSSQETARVLNLSVSRVNVTLHRAIKALRASVIAQSGGELIDVAKGR